VLGWDRHLHIDEKEDQFIDLLVKSLKSAATGALKLELANGFLNMLIQVRTKTKLALTIVLERTYRDEFE
jgi:hypothetical protein